MVRIAVMIAAARMTYSAVPGLAQTDTSYPEKPVRVVVPWAAGGNIDVLTRVAAHRLSQIWSQQFVVDGR